VLALCRKYGLILTLANQTESQVSGHLAGALQNALAITFRLGPDDAEAAARRFAPFDPYVVKRVDRGRPVYFSRAELVTAWTQELAHLPPREAFVKVGAEVTRIRTLAVPALSHTDPGLARVLETYAGRLLTPRAAVEAEFARRRTGAPPTLPTPMRPLPAPPARPAPGTERIRRREPA
jgi:hypothetical protein